MARRSILMRKTTGDTQTPGAVIADFSKTPWQQLKEIAKGAGLSIRGKKRAEIEAELSAKVSQ